VKEPQKNPADCLNKRVRSIIIKMIVRAYLVDDCGDLYRKERILKSFRDKKKSLLGLGLGNGHSFLFIFCSLLSLYFFEIRF
jgi:hypothetical protein